MRWKKQNDGRGADMHFRLRIETNGAAFCEDCSWELSGILQGLAGDLQSFDETAGKLRDINGNTCGAWEIVGDDDEGDSGCTCGEAYNLRLPHRNRCEYCTGRPADSYDKQAAVAADLRASATAALAKLRALRGEEPYELDDPIATAPTGVDDPSQWEEAAVHPTDAAIDELNAAVNPTGVDDGVFTGVVCTVCAKRWYPAESDWEGHKSGRCPDCNGGLGL